MTYTWKIESMYVKSFNELSNVVVRVQWRKIGTDTDGSTGSYMGITTFDPTLVSSDSFIQYDDLTEEAVLAWIIAGIPEGPMANIDANIQDIADYNKNPEVNKRMPWVPEPTPLTTTE